MNYASKDLIEEHDGILFGLKILENMVSRLKHNQAIETDHLVKMVDFFKIFADKCHHGKEEGMLFPVMEKYGIPNKNGPINQMLLEHVEGRKYIAHMVGAIIAEKVNINDFIQGATNYIELLRSHIEKENQVLFPMGDKVIPSDIQEELLDSFEKYEKEVMGEGVHDKLHALLHEFENKYLKKEVTL